MLGATAFTLLVIEVAGLGGEVEVYGCFFFGVFVHALSGGFWLIIFACSSVTGHQLPNSVNQYRTLKGSMPYMIPLWFVSGVICMI